MPLDSDVGSPDLACKPKKNSHRTGDYFSLVAATGNGGAERNCAHACMQRNEEAEEQRL